MLEWASARARATLHYAQCGHLALCSPADGLRLLLEQSYSEGGCILKLRSGVSLTDAIASDAW